ncbi:MAG: Crp/Fnr family transcriptional regulator [Streptosporangiaceae bacterium]|jgi:CRP-like cAMP-binding protein
MAELVGTAAMTTGAPSARAPGKDPEWPAGSLLGLLPAATRVALLDIGTAVEYQEPRVLMREGELSTHVILLRSAVTKVIGRAGNGRESLLAIRVTGDIVGELGAIDKKPRSATVATCGPARLNVIRSADFEGFLRRYPEAALALSRVIGDRLRMATQHRVDISCNSVRVRVAHVLDELATGYGRPHENGIVIDLDLTQKELGELVGAADTTVHKALRAMREAGLVETGYQQLIITDIAGLREVTELADAKPYFYQNVAGDWTDD